MKNRLFNRTWISPIITITFLVVGITGLLLKFHIKGAGIKALHEWIGYAFMLSGTIHLALNWKMFMAHFRERSAIAATVACIVMTLSLFILAGMGEKQPKVHPVIQTLDLDANGVIDADEIAAAAGSLGRLDRDRDGVLSVMELNKSGKRSAGNVVPAAGEKP